MNARIKNKLQRRGVARDHREHPLAVAAARMAEDGCDIYRIVAELTPLSADLRPALGQFRNIYDIARKALYLARVREIVDHGYTKQEAKWLLAGRSPEDGSPIKQPTPPNPGTPDLVMRLYRKPDGGAAAGAADIALREKSAERNRRDGGISTTDTEDLRIAREEAKRACWRRAGLTFDELFETGIMVIASERDRSGDSLHGALLRLRIRDRIVRAIARRNKDDYTLILCGLMKEDGPGHSDQ